MSLPNSKKGVYDYYIFDYLQNVRMILTEGTHVASNTCTMETSRASVEEPIFGQTGSANEVVTTRYATNLTNWTGNTSASVSRLGNLAGKNLGPNTLQRVMAGDEVTATVKYFFEGTAGGCNSSFASTLINGLVQAITGSPATGGLIKDNVVGISNQLNGTTGFINSVQPGCPGGNTPQAYLTILFFDDRFNFIEAVDGGVAQQQVASSVGSNGSALGLLNIKAPKNGYAFAYVSNASDQHVYFDDLLVGITHRSIIEENHYYAYGLKITGLSSKKFGTTEEGNLGNKNLYNGKEYIEDADLNWYDYGFRNYDPQIGRFVQLDPLTDDYPSLTPYQYASCDPITNIDIDGLEGEEAVNAGKAAAEIGTKAVSNLSTTVAKAIVLENISLVGVRTVAKTAPKTISIGLKTRIILKTVQLTSQVLNVSESTRGISDQQLSIIRDGAYTPPPKIETTIGPCNYCPQGPLSDNDNLMTPDSDPIAKQVRKETIERVNNKPGNSFPIIGNLIRAGNFELIGFHSEARGAIKDAGIEAATWYVGGKVFSYLKFARPAAPTVQANRTAGNLFRDQLAEAMRAEGRTVNIEVYKWTPFGKRFMDLDVWYKGVNLGGIEAKVGNSRYFLLQRLKDAWLGANGYPVQLVRKPTIW